MGNIGLHGTNCIYKTIFLQPSVVSPNKAEGILEQARNAFAAVRRHSAFLLIRFKSRGMRVLRNKKRSLQIILSPIEKSDASLRQCESDRL